MVRAIQIQWTCGNIDEAREVGRFLVQERYVACVNIIPEVESIFTWEGKVDMAREAKVLMKTRSGNFEAVKGAILQKASYDVPEILSFPIEDGHREYLDWLDESTIDFSTKEAKP